MTFPDVQGRCPACGWTTLFLANGGYITCSRADCPQPDAASTLLERDVRTSPVTCDATEMIAGFFGKPVAFGPCVLRHGHDGPGHKAANGAQWWPTGVTAADTADPAEPEPPAALTLTYATPPLLYTACDEGRHIAHPGETCDEHETDKAAMRNAWNRLMAPVNEELAKLHADATTED